MMQCDCEVIIGCCKKQPPKEQHDLWLLRVFALPSKTIAHSGTIFVSFSMYDPMQVSAAAKIANSSCH